MTRPRWRRGKKEQYRPNECCRVGQRKCPLASVQMAPSMLRPRNRPTCPCAYCRDLNIEGAVRAAAPYASLLFGPLPAPVSPPKAATNHLSGTVHSISHRHSSFSLAIVLVGPLPAPVFLSHSGGTSLSSAAFWLKVVVLGSFPSLSGARAGNFPASLPRTVGAAMAASSAQKDPTDALHDESVLAPS